MTSIRMRVKNPDFRDDIDSYVKSMGLIISSMEHRKNDGVLIVNLMGSVSSEQIKLIESFSDSLNKSRMEKELRNYGVDAFPLDSSKLDKYVESRVVDLKSAKEYIKDLSRLVLLLYKRVEST